MRTLAHRLPLCLLVASSPCPPLFQHSLRSVWQWSVYTLRTGALSWLTGRDSPLHRQQPAASTGDKTERAPRVGVAGSCLLNEESQNKHRPHKAERVGTTGPGNWTRLLRLREGKGLGVSELRCQEIHTRDCEGGCREGGNKWWRAQVLSDGGGVAGTAESGPLGHGWSL